jgi:hypothetical protein
MARRAHTYAIRLAVEGGGQVAFTVSFRIEGDPRTPADRRRLLADHRIFFVIIAQIGGARGPSAQRREIPARGKITVDFTAQSPPA